MNDIERVCHRLYTLVVIAYDNEDIREAAKRGLPDEVAEHRFQLAVEAARAVMRKERA